LIGFGTSSIGHLPQGYVQNASTTVDYRSAITAERLATVRGIGLTAEDRIRREIIERLMCDLAVDLEAVAVSHGYDPSAYAAEIKLVDALARDEIVTRNGYHIVVPDKARPFLRNVCAIFDHYLLDGAARHSHAL
jgi:oxygen-independent coproporphyrinogen-3 oxidase